MNFTIKIITPAEVGMEYTAEVTRDKDYIPAGPLTATGDMDVRKLAYKTGGDEGGVDVWELGIIYTGNGPREITVVALDEDAKPIRKFKPTVVDSHG